MARYHINPKTGNPGLCKADPSKPGSRGCRFGELDDQHYATRAEAQRAYEIRMESAEESSQELSSGDLLTKLKGELVRPQSIDYDTILRELNYIEEWEKPWTAEEEANLRSVERIGSILEREPLTETDLAEARKILSELHPIVTVRQVGGYDSSKPNAENWRARDRMIHELGDDLIRRRLADDLQGALAEPIDNPRLMGLQLAQEAALRAANRPVYSWTKPGDAPYIGEVEGGFQEAIARVKRGDAEAPQEIVESTDHRSLLSERERIFNTLHPDSPLYDQHLYLASVFPVNELKAEMDRVGLENVSVSHFENGRERGNVYTVLKPDGGTRSFSVYEHRNTDSIIINGKDDWDGQGLPYAADSKQEFFAEFAPDERDRAAQALTFYMVNAQSGQLEGDGELAAKVSRRDWNAILDESIPGFKEWRQSKITDRYIAPENENEEDILKRLDF